MTHLGHIWAVGRMDHKSDKITYANDPIGTYLDATENRNGERL